MYTKYKEQHSCESPPLTNNHASVAEEVLGPDHTEGGEQEVTAQVKAQETTEVKVEGESDWTVEDATREKWSREQEELKKQLILEDVTEWQTGRLICDETHSHPQALRYIAGVDISFVKGDLYNACAALVVLEYPELNVVYEDVSLVELKAPYIAGFLAFREAEFFVQKMKKLRAESPQYEPQVIVVDGNGILHYNGFGLACHLGVTLDVPTIGAAKNILQVDGLVRDEAHLDKINSLSKAGDTFPLVGSSGETLGKALRTVDGAKNPMYISAGHKISLDTAVWVIETCSKYRVPEPTRQADQLSREYLRINWPHDS